MCFERNLIVQQFGNTHLIRVGETFFEELVCQVSRLSLCDVEVVVRTTQRKGKHDLHKYAVSQDLEC